ncbi:transposase [Candidatus Tisiphia endosymbiont of Nemotelus uliginosus]|uniref:transposase n=1 Tax=Candidatus Tisiphia endosymbiont of Nemotelus uliginosus TaxID=3077926 RepID=UPI0035C90F23
MRIFTGGVAHIAKVIEEDLGSRVTGLHKSHISGIADLAASALSCSSVNSGEWIAVLPRKTGDVKSKERYISRLLSNCLIEPKPVMHGFVPEIITMAASKEKTAILILDQSKISTNFECLMISLRVGERAMPIAWKVEKTQGAIGFEVQESLIKDVAKMIPEGVKILLAANRFYGTHSLINLCQSLGWSYRVRLKSNLILMQEGGEITTGDAVNMKLTSLENQTFHNTNVTTNIGILQEAGCKEPWIIAMDCLPSKYRVLDYGMRWGIECMFSDFKSRGFSITKTHLQHEDRIERLILVLTVALFWAISTGAISSKKTL